MKESKATFFLQKPEIPADIFDQARRGGPHKNDNVKPWPPDIFATHGVRWFVRYHCGVRLYSPIS